VSPNLVPMSPNLVPKLKSQSRMIRPILGARGAQITPDQAVNAPFRISLDFDNPVVGISNMVLGVGVVLGGGPYSVGTHASTTVLTGIGPSNPCWFS
jgi:hypothetical protein